MQVKDVMSRGLKTIDADGTLAEATRIMDSLGVGALPVTRDDALVGRVTDRDIVFRGVARGLYPDDRRIELVMPTELFTCAAGAELGDARKLMQERQVRRLVVTDAEGVPVGIVSLANLALRMRDLKRVCEVIRELSRPG